MSGQLNNNVPTIKRLKIWSKTAGGGGGGIKLPAAQNNTGSELRHCHFQYVQQFMKSSSPSPQVDHPDSFSRGLRHKEPACDFGRT